MWKVEKQRTTSATLGQVGRYRRSAQDGPGTAPRHRAPHGKGPEGSEGSPGLPHLAPWPLLNLIILGSSTHQAPASQTFPLQEGTLAPEATQNILSSCFFIFGIFCILFHGMSEVVAVT